MRERGVSTVGAVVLSGLAGILVAGLMMDWMVVDVRTPAPEDIHIKVPFPLIVGRIATSFIPDEALEEATVPPEVRAQRDVAIAAVRALVDAPDATIVKVEAEDAIVDITKRGDDLHIAVDADDAIVKCVVPLDGVLHALEGWDWETFEPSLVFDVLAAAPMGNLITVEVDDGTRVAINMW